MQKPDKLAEMRARSEATFKARHEQAQDAPIALRDYRLAEQDKWDQLERLRQERLSRATKVSPSKSG
jgi:hypothetical protein